MRPGYIDSGLRFEKVGTDQYTFSGYDLCGYLVPPQYKEALERYVDEKWALMHRAKGLVHVLGSGLVFGGEAMADTMAEAAEELIRGWVEIERRLEAQQ